MLHNTEIILMKVELKKVKEFKQMSRETICFHAEVWIDGKKAAVVENEGSGGPNRWSDWDAEKKVSAFVKQNPEFKDDEFELADILIGELLNVESERARAVRDLRTKALFVRKAGGVGSTKALTDAQRQYIAVNPAKVLESLKAERFLTDPVEVAKLMLASAGLTLHFS